MDSEGNMITLAAFIFTLAILVAIHEYGHFQMARWCGVKVLKFSIGFGRPIFSKRFGKDQTEFVLSALPFGGFVKMLDERELSEDEKSLTPPSNLARAFNRQSVYKRIAIVAAGPIANLLLAVALYWMLIMQGTIGLKPMLADVAEGSPANIAQLHKGDLILNIDGEDVKLWQDVQWILIQKVFKISTVKIEVLDSHQQKYIRTMDLTGITESDLSNDFLSKLGLNPSSPNVEPIIGSVLQMSSADKAGLHVGDKVLSVDGSLIRNWDMFVKIIQNSPDKILKLKVERGNKALMINVTPSSINKNGKTIGQVGASVFMDESMMHDYLITHHFSTLESLKKAVKKTYETSAFSLKMLGNMLTGDISIKSISGPVTIATYAGQSANLGLNAFIAFLAVISISLGVLNLLPIPVLDGGHLLYYMVEIIKGSPVPEQVMEMGQRIGLAILGLLMACALYNDINRLITG